MPTDHELRAAFAYEQLKCFAKFVEPSYTWASHSLKLIDALEKVERGEITRLIVSMPPRHGKSLTSSQIFPAWHLIRNPHARLILAAHTASLAESFSRKIRNIIAQIGPYYDVGLASDSASVQRWDLASYRGGLVAAGLGGPLTGHGGDLIVLDDPIKDSEAAHSETQKRNALEWYRSVLRSRLHPGGKIVFCMTRWAEDDLAGTLLSEMSEPWAELRMPMVSSDGSILWPSRYSQEEVDALRRSSGAHVWQSLYQQEPAPAGGSIFKTEWLNQYGTLPYNCSDWLMSWDLAFKGTNTSDFVVGQVWCRKDSSYFLVDQVRDRWNFVETVSKIRELSQMYPQCTLKLIEDKANGPAVIDTLKSEIHGIVPVKPDGSKEARARAVTPLFEAGNVFFPRQPWVDALRTELAGFPNAKNDDQVDAMTQALRRLMLCNNNTQKTLKVASSRGWSR